LGSFLGLSGPNSIILTMTVSVPLCTLCVPHYVRLFSSVQIIAIVPQDILKSITHWNHIFNVVCTFHSIVLLFPL
jgi:hypothetical protein